MANRHMATSRPHNRVARYRGSRAGLSAADREARENAIHNRGAILNPEAQKAHGKLREELTREMAKLAEASAEELGAMRGMIVAQKQQMASLHREVLRLEGQLAIETRTRETWQIAHKDRLDRLLATLHAFMDLTWRARWRWILTGN